MRLDEFEARFGFRPADALEKKHFAGSRPSQLIRDALEAGITGDTDLSNVIME
jgi:hypothetical protein